MYKVWAKEYRHVQSVGTGILICPKNEQRTTNTKGIEGTYYVSITQFIYGKVYEKRDLACIVKKYNKNALRLICYNFQTVNAINFLFSTLHTAPFLYGKKHFGVLHLLRVSIATFDTPLGSNPP